MGASVSHVDKPSTIDETEYVFVEHNNVSSTAESRAYTTIDTGKKKSVSLKNRRHRKKRKSRRKQ